MKTTLEGKLPPEPGGKFLVLVGKYARHAAFLI